jgi:hypothetical protein
VPYPGFLIRGAARSPLTCLSSVGPSGHDIVDRASNAIVSVSPNGSVDDLRERSTTHTG